jgi:hypothetical protein
LKFGTKCLIVVVVVVMTSLCVFASDTATTFKTGPFTGSIDLGMLCNDINASKPVQTETLGGDSYTRYVVMICGVEIDLTRYDKDTFESTTTWDDGVASTLVGSGADKDTIAVYDREINSKPGAVGKGYVPKFEGTLYTAGFYVSPKTKCYITIWDNETKMISAIKSIHIAEAA